MLAIVPLCFLATLHLTAASASQRPQLTRCPGTNVSTVQIRGVVLEDVKLGGTAVVKALLQVNQTTGNNLVVRTSFKTFEGRPLQCVHALVPVELKLCDDTTDGLITDWDNKCPVKAGFHTAQLSVQLPDITLVKVCLKDGQVNATLEIQDDGETLDCVTFPITIDLN